MSSLMDRLKEAQNNLKPVQQTNEFTVPPLGTLQCSISSVKLVENKKRNNQLQLQWIFTILDSDYAGKLFSQYTDIEGQYTMTYQFYMKALGQEIDVTALPILLENRELIGKIVEVRVRQNPKSENFPYIDIVKEVKQFEPEPEETVSTESKNPWDK